jgi:UDP-glucose 4-epimerase
MNQKEASGARSVLITGAEGYLGRLVVEALAQQPADIATIIASDIRPPASPLPNVIYLTADLRSEELTRALSEHQVDTLVHLAAIVTPGPRDDREASHAVEVRGTRSLLRACLAAGVERFVYTSSGAAYGYYADNPDWLCEDDQIRGNPEFAYSDHKRQVEEMLARWRERHPELRQLIFRPGIILGATANNQITALFEKPMILGVSGSQSPFVFIWDKDVVGAIVKGVREGGEGIYNLAGDGVLTMPEIAQRLGKRYVAVPAWLLRGALWVLSKLGLTQYGPEQVGFLQYRPVLANRRLKDEFGYIPQKTTREVFEFFLQSRGIAPVVEAEPQKPVTPKSPPPPKNPAVDRREIEAGQTQNDQKPARSEDAEEMPRQSSTPPIDRRGTEAGQASDEPKPARGDDTREMLRQTSRNFRRRFGKKRKD